MFRKTTAEALRAAAGDRTGCLVVTDRQTRSAARIFLIQGEPYAVDLDGFVPDVLARLVASGALDAAQRAELAGDPRGACRAVERGWVSVDVLSDVHTELLIAGIGAIVDRDRVTITLEDGRTTDMLCALPAPVAELLDLVAIRRERTQATWRAVTPTGTPRETGLSVGTVDTVGDAPELVAFLRQAATGATVDEAARAQGLTRAEAVHLAALAVLQHRAVAVPVRPAPVRSLAVPEQFGVVVPDPSAAAAEDGIAALEDEIAQLEIALERARERLAALTPGGR